MKTTRIICWQWLILMLPVIIALLAACSKEDENQVTIPVVTTVNVTGISSTTATGGGIITSDGGAPITSRGICWSATPNPTLSGNISSDGSTGMGSFSSSIYGLAGNTTYYVRAYATNSAGTGYGDSKTFSTLGQSGNTVTLSATVIDTATVILNGIVNAGHLTLTVSFDYGLNASYGYEISALQNPVTGNTNTNVSATIAGLLPGTEYHFRVKTVNNYGGIDYGSDQTFITPGQTPLVTALESSNIKSVSATLNGSVNANHLSTVVTFEYGTTTSYGQVAPANQNPVTGNISTDVSASITGLSVNITYHYRVRAENSLGISYSNDMVFTTHYVVGESYFGGIIFYIDNTGVHGLVCAPIDQSPGAIWYNGNYVLTNATGTAIGSGAANTSAIVLMQGPGAYAAKLCDDLEMNGYSDWFLPSKDEINLMYPYLNHGDYGFAEYWSSSEGDLYNAWKFGVQTGGGDSNYYDKFGMYPVRAARAF
jgi:hypothetical protein